MLDRVNLELDDTTIPSLENINQVMTNLDTLLADSNISADDKTFITTIREQYESIKNSLERTQRVDTYIAEAASIYTFL